MCARIFSIKELRTIYAIFFGKSMVSHHFRALHSITFPKLIASIVTTWSWASRSARSSSGIIGPVRREVVTSRIRIWTIPICWLSWKYGPTLAAQHPESDSDNRRFFRGMNRQAVVEVDLEVQDEVDRLRILSAAVGRTAALNLSQKECSSAGRRITRSSSRT